MIWNCDKKVRCNYLINEGETVKLGTDRTAYYFPTIEAVKAFIKLYEDKISNTSGMLMVYRKYKNICFEFYDIYGEIWWAGDYLEEFIKHEYKVIVFRQRTE